VGARLFRRVAMKVPKPSGVEELRGEVESLGGLTRKHTSNLPLLVIVGTFMTRMLVFSDPNVVQILGMAEGPEPDGSTAWMMALEWCQSDLSRILYKTSDEGYERYSLELMVDLAEQIAKALVYIHGEGKAHLDIKPENVLVATEGGRYVGKLADFGMAYTDDDDSAAEPVAAVSSSSGSGSATRTQEPQVPDVKAALDEIKPYGTWEYMAPEGWKRKYGKPGFASDIFSFGMMVWEMVARVRIYTAFSGVADIPNPDGSAKVELVAARLAGGQRPEASGGCPAALYKLMQACWVPHMTKRPKAPQLLTAIQGIRATSGALGPPEHVAPTAEVAELTFEDFLQQLDLTDKKDDLADYLEEGNELRDLKQMDEDDLNEDILNDEDLDLDEDVKDKFRDAVAALRAPAVADGDEATEEAGGGMGGAWAELMTMLGAEGSATATAIQDLWATVADLEGEVADKDNIVNQLEKQAEEKDGHLAANAKEMVKKDEVIAEKDEQLAQKDEQLAQKDGQLAQKDGQLAQKDGQLAQKDEQLAQKDGELEQLRAQLERLEGVPPQ
jgi:serine/threonine protein kinase